VSLAVTGSLISEEAAAMVPAADLRMLNHPVFLAATSQQGIAKMAIIAAMLIIGITDILAHQPDIIMAPMLSMAFPWQTLRQLQLSAGAEL